MFLTCLTISISNVCCANFLARYKARFCLFICCTDFLPFSKATEEEILGAGSEPSEAEGVKTNSKEVNIANSYRT